MSPAEGHRIVIKKNQNITGDFDFTCVVTDLDVKRTGASIHWRSNLTDIAEETIIGKHKIGVQVSFEAGDRARASTKFIILYFYAKINFTRCSCDLFHFYNKLILMRVNKI